MGQKPENDCSHWAQKSLRPELRVALRLSFGAALFSGSPSLSAAEIAPTRTTAPANGDTPESNAFPSAAEANVVLVGSNAEWPELEALLSELLDRDGIVCHFLRAARFGADDLFAREHERPARVFIRLDGNQLARLYFRSESGQRFLLRTLTLENGLDDVGRERIGQVVEASLVALLRSPAGLDREQASVEMARQASENPLPKSGAPAQAAHAVPVLRRSDQVVKEPARGRALELGFDLRYAAVFSGAEFDPAHGPGAELSIGLRSERLLLRARLLAEHFLPQKLGIRELGTELETNALRLGLDLGVPLTARHTLVLALGAGADWVSIEPGAPRVADVTPVESHTNTVPFLRSEVRYELIHGQLLLGLGIFSDVSLRDTHYDLVESNGRRVLATPWLIRPGASFSIGLRW